MSDVISTLAQKLRPYWLRDQTNGSGGSISVGGGGGGGGMASHALFGVYHTGELDPSQAPWAVTQDELDAIDTHARQHDILDPADHTVDGVQWQIIGLTSTDTLGKLTPLSDVTGTPDEAILKSDSDGALTLKTLNLGLAMSLFNGGNAAAGPDIQFNGAGLLAADTSLYLNIDSLNATTNSALIISRNGASSGGATEIARFTEGGRLGIGTNAPGLELDVNGSIRAGTAIFVGAASTWYSTNNIAIGPDVQFATNGLIAAETSVYVNVDSTNTASGAFIISKGASTSAAIELVRVTNAGRLGVGTNGPSYELDVIGTIRGTVAVRTADVIASVNVRTPSIDTGSGALTLQPANATVKIAGTTPTISTDTGQSLTLAPTDDVRLNPGSLLVKLQPNTFIQSSNYASQLTGVRVSWLGEGDFRYLYADELHAKAFIADIEQALAGGQIITKSVTILASNFTAPAAGGTATLHVKDLPSATGMQVFQSGDIIRLRQFDRSGGALSITNCWGVVTSPSDNADGTQNWTFTRSVAPNAGAMSTGAVVKKDAIVLDYGVSGNGFYEVNAIDGLRALNSPYAQIVNWTTHPATGQTVRARLGNLRGIFGVNEEYGLFAGSGTASTDSYVRISSEVFRINNISLQMYNGIGAQTFLLASDGSTMWIGPSSSNKQLDYSGGNLSITGNINAATGTIANWAIGVVNANTISSSNIRLTSGASAEARIEVGASGDDIAGMLSRSLGASAVFWAGKSYANLISSPSTVPFRVHLNGDLFASNATIVGDVTATTGYIGSVANGWTITSDRITANGIRLVSFRSDAGLSSRIELGDYDAAGSGQLAVIGMRGVPAGTVATSTVAQWAGRNYSNRGTAPFRVTFGGDLFASSANITGTVTATAGAIGGWALTVGSIASTNIALYSGGSGLARLEVGASGDDYAGVLSRSSGTGVVFWAGKSYANLISSPGTVPFRVTLAGDLTSTSAVFGTTTLVDTTGIFINAQPTWNVNYGYKFKLGGNVGAGMTSVYVAGDQATTQIWHNTNTEASISPLISGINANLILRSVAGGALKSANIELNAMHSSAGTNARFVLSHDGTNRVGRLYGSVFYFNNGTDREIYHTGNLTPSDYATDAELTSAVALLAPKANPTFTGLIIAPTMSLQPRTTEPSLSTGQVLMFTVYNGTFHRFVIAYNHGGIVKYRYLNLEDTSDPPSWNYETAWADVYD